MDKLFLCCLNDSHKNTSKTELTYFAYAQQKRRIKILTAPRRVINTFQIQIPRRGARFDIQPFHS